MEIHDEWPVGERRYLSEASMARINARRTEPSQCQQRLNCEPLSAVES